MTTAPTLNFRSVEDADAPAVLELLTAALAGGPTGERSQAYLDWKHRDNPFGRSPGMLAEHDGRVVGVRLFLRWELRAGERTLRTVRAVDTATHPDYQRQGIFRRLTLGMLEHLDRDEGLDLVFNTPNADSRPGYLRMGWAPVGELGVRISPVRPVRFLRGMAGARSANASGSAADVAPVAEGRIDSLLPAAADVLDDRDDVAALLARRSVGQRIHTPLSAAYLHWRYVQPPGLDYRAVEVRERGELVGLGLGRVRHRAGLAEFTLGDVLVPDGDVRTARRVLRAARRAGVDHVAVHTAPGTEIERAALSAGYVTVPGRGIGLVANPRPPCPVDVLDAAAWQLSLGELEVF